VGFLRKSLQLAEARAERRSIEGQLSTAREIQMRLTPKSLADVPGLDLAVVYKPALWVGGDYCDVWPLPGGRVAFAVGDVAGKGLPAAMVMTCLHAGLRTTLGFCPDLAEAVGHLNRHIETHMPDGTFVTLVLGVFDPADGSLRYVNAGHILPIRRDRTGEVVEVGEPRNPPVGLVQTTFDEDRAELDVGGGLVVVTDGITESGTRDGDLFGTDRLVQTLAAARGRTAGDIAGEVEDAATGFRQPLGQQDDVTVFAMFRREA
jgi:serine phosphatase RsbU (regulator of sigma subunit)